MWAADQFMDQETGDVKIFVNFSEPAMFYTRLHSEMFPRIGIVHHHEEALAKRGRATSQRPVGLSTRLMKADKGLDVRDQAKLRALPAVKSAGKKVQTNKVTPALDSLGETSHT